jgi:hypothetical protein
MAKKISQLDLLKEYFTKNPNRDIKHPEVVDWVVKEFFERTGEVFRDPYRAIRSLSQKGFLIKVSKGLYRYDPHLEGNKDLEDFTQSQKEIILKRDDYRCVICGKGKKDGVELHVDHIKPKDLGGAATLENGQTICYSHFQEKILLKKTDSGKRSFIRLLELARKNNDEKTIKFCIEILEVFERNGINGHIEWE